MNHSPNSFGPPGQQRFGFTLIEILSVIAILSILTALLFPAAGAILNQARIAESRSNLRQLVQANFAHAMANSGRFAYATNERNNKRWCAQRSGSGWDRTRGYLSPYLSYEARAAVCPLLESLLDEDTPSFELGTGGYGYNSAYIGGIEGRRMGRPSLRIDQIADPSNTIMFATTAYAREGGVQEYPFTEPPFWPSGGRPSPTTHFRANGQAIIGWADGRISLEGEDERPDGSNPHGGVADDHHLGWFGPEEKNGYWNPSNIWANGKPL